MRNPLEIVLCQKAAEAQGENHFDPHIVLRGIAFGFVASHRDRKSSRPDYGRNERAKKFF